MVQILLRDLGEETVKRLKERAKGEGRSLQAEVKMILENAAEEPMPAVKVDMARARGLCEEFRKRFEGRKFSDSHDPIREDRER